MLRVVEILETSAYYLHCKFNNGAIKKLDVRPIIEQHIHLNGVEELLNETVFNNVSIGEFGEIVWPEIVKMVEDGKEIKWDYDISPEFAYQNSTFVAAS
jgi:hypothetical protein